MATKDSVVYPVTKETMHEYAESIFAPIRRDENATAIWVPMAGRRMWSKFIIENIFLFEKELPHSEKYVLVYIEPLDLTAETLTGYLRLMAKSFIDKCNSHKECQRVMGKMNMQVFEEETTSYSKLLEALKEVLQQVTESGLRVVFFLGEFDELGFTNTIFYHNLKSLWNRLYPGITFIFLMRERPTREDNIKAWGELNEVILQNIVYAPILSKKDTDYIIDRFSNDYGIKISEKVRDVLHKLCGGHPYMLKVCFRILSKHKGDGLKIEELEKMLRSYYETKSVSKGILNVRSNKEKQILNNLVAGKEPSDEDGKDIVRFLERLGIVKLSNEKYKLFGMLFEDALKNGKNEVGNQKESNGDLVIDPQSGAILFGSDTVEEKFTRQEYAILHMFLENIGVLKTRDDIGDVLWGKEAYEKYSDWAIDQVISKLRKKLDEMNLKVSLHTVRGKGYKLTAS